MSEAAHIRFRVRGRVQGVGFRRFVLDHARELGLGGWVRNAADGAVEGEARGPAPAIGALRTALERGPRGAVVADVVIEDVAAEMASESSSFEVRR